MRLRIEGEFDEVSDGIGLFHCGFERWDRGWEAKPFEIGEDLEAVQETLREEEGILNGNFSVKCGDLMDNGEGIVGNARHGGRSHAAVVERRFDGSLRFGGEFGLFGAQNAHDVGTLRHPSMDFGRHKRRREAGFRACER